MDSLEVRWHFSPRGPIPQAVVRAGPFRHKGVGSAGRGARIHPGSAIQLLKNAALVGEAEVSAKCDTGASNHPQSLWITLWASFRRQSQVAYRKGFFFGRSKFERSTFSVFNQ